MGVGILFDNGEDIPIRHLTSARMKMSVVLILRSNRQKQFAPWLCRMCFQDSDFYSTTC